MNPIWAPADLPAATRGEFLAHRARAVQELEQRLSSPVGLLVNCGLVFGAALALMLAGTALGDVRVETFHVAFAVVMAAAALTTVPIMVRRALRTRKLMAAFIAWETAERQARSLPSGHLPPDLRMPFDARRDADFEHFAYVTAVKARFRPLPTWLVLRGTPAGLGWVVGFVLMMGAVSEGSVAAAMAWGAAGGYLLICSLVVTASVVRAGWRLAQLLRAEQADIRTWRAERTGPVTAAKMEPAAVRRAALTVAPLVAMCVLYLVVGVSSPEVAVIAVAIVVLAALVTGVVLLVRKRRAAAPAEHDLTSAPPY
jgi:hypothetical protein